MNPANHGQCHIRRNSRDGRSEGVNREELEHTDISQNGIESLEETPSHKELEDIAQSLQNHPPPEVKVVGPQGNCQRSCYGSVSSILNTDCGHLDDTSTTNTTGVHCPNMTPSKMQRRLKFFFMNPIEKWHARRRFPWKLLLQIFKIVVVTAQLCLFAQQRYSHVNYLWDTKISFSHMFLKGWDATREVQVYPPGSGPLAVYEKQDFFQYLDYAITTYSTINEKAIGTYSYKYQDGELLYPTLCMAQYAGGYVSPNNNTFMLNDTITKSCIEIPVEVNVTSWSSEAFLKNKSYIINFDLLMNIEFTFHLHTIKLRVNLPFDTPECYGLTGKVIFNNHDHDGQMLVNLDVAAQVLECQGSVKLASEAYTLKTTELFFRQQYGKELSLEERMEFVNLWYLLICINDIFIILGSCLKIGLESKNYEGYLDTWNVCSLFLGLGNLLVWFGCLRYLGFFTTYNVLILTLKKCIPNVLRYSICLLMVFAGYCLCGWLVLGPYHFKFRSFSSTMECLYSLINGDDMFATFSSTSGKDPVVWWFSRIYLYSFISLFIYVILSLFIAIIMDAYETIKNYYENGFPLNELMKFVEECTEEPSSGVFQDEDDHTIHDVINSICCCGYEANQQSTEYEPLLT
ncbi:mucolipin-3-like isoform X4 [Portunus trituberculatus]|uniref:mucolipin-3-like isoform X4 n=1 Tax=Portunus trituberculatus TaxID=210409 RepID=UPI001E1D0E6D|nr:mucolipin-3-like isoform X4 [Portunus trituberculatus]